MIIGDGRSPVMTIGGFDNVEMLPSCAVNVHSCICFVFAKSIEKADRVENFALSIIAPLISVAPNCAPVKSDWLRFE